ncbi:hypothetical protein N9H39_08405 [Gammaproteobacteria bacterium]|nr:hypothetical protein [Gammaproteobacteria bacterium]
MGELIVELAGTWYLRFCLRWLMGQFGAIIGILRSVMNRIESGLDVRRRSFSTCPSLSSWVHYDVPSLL